MRRPVDDPRSILLVCASKRRPMLAGTPDPEAPMGDTNPDPGERRR